MGEVDQICCTAAEGVCARKVARVQHVRQVVTGGVLGAAEIGVVNPAEQRTKRVLSACSVVTGDIGEGLAHGAAHKLISNQR